MRMTIRCGSSSKSTISLAGLGEVSRRVTACLIVMYLSCCLGKSFSSCLGFGVDGSQQRGTNGCNHRQTSGFFLWHRVVSQSMVLSCSAPIAGSFLKDRSRSRRPSWLPSRSPYHSSQRSLARMAKTSKLQNHLMSNLPNPHLGRSRKNSNSNRSRSRSIHPNPSLNEIPPLPVVGNPLPPRAPTRHPHTDVASTTSLEHP